MRATIDDGGDSVQNEIIGEPSPNTQNCVFESIKTMIWDAQRYNCPSVSIHQ